MSRNRIVHRPENMMARLGSSPITTGNTNVAPNMATTCCAPRPMVLPHGSRWFGITASPGAGFTTSHLNIDIARPPDLTGCVPRSHKVVLDITHPHWRLLPKERRSGWQQVARGGAPSAAG